jgi:hypothetical protein
MFLGRVVARLDLAVVEAYRAIQEVARETFRRELQQDRTFWQECRGRWGQGPGYREDIRDMTAEQLASNCEDAHSAVRQLVTEEWAKIVALLEEMLEEHGGLESGLLLPSMTV